MTLTPFRLDSLEQEVASLRDRLERLERATAAKPAPAPARPVAPRPSPPPPRPSLPPRPAAPARSVDLEDLLGGRLLGLAGGAAVLLGVAFFVALAVGRGWIGETARVSLAAAASTALLAAGVWLYGRRGRLQAALAMVATAVASLYLTLAAATALYHLLPTLVALAAALAIGGVATAIAVRWNTRTVAGLGIGGALVAPALAGSLSTASMLFLAVAFGCSGAVLVWRRWDWLAVGAFLVSAAQLAGWLLLSNPRDSHVIAVLSLFAGLNLAGILGHELRLAGQRLRPSTSALALAGALSFGGLGYVALDAGGVWLAGLAAAHALAGAVSLAHRRVSDEIGLLLLATSLTLADVAFGALAHGPALAIGWALSAAVLAAAVRGLTSRVELVQLTVGGQLALAVAHALMFDARPGSISAGTADLGTAVSVLAAIALAAFACARQTLDENREWRAILDGLSLAALALVTAAMLDGTTLVLAWAVESVALAQLAQRMRDGLARAGALAFLALAAAHALVFEATPRALLYGVDDLVAAVVALGLVAGAALACSRLGPVRSALERPVLEALGVGMLFYLASIAIITPFQPGPNVVETGLGLGVRQQGQVLLSAFWSGCGVVGMWLGLRRDDRRIRLAAFGLLALAVAKVFLYDLSTLASVYRVLSFVAVGLLLLAAAFAYQRLRPTATHAGAA